MHAKNNLKAAIQGECPSHKPRVLLEKSCVAHLIQEMNDKLLSQEDRFLAHYLLSTKVHRLGDDVQGKMYEAYGNEMMRWKPKWLFQQEKNNILWLTFSTA